MYCTFDNMNYVQLSACLVSIINHHHHLEWFWCNRCTSIVFQILFLFTPTILYFVANNITYTFNIEGEFSTSRFPHSMNRQSRMDYDY